MKPCRRNRKKIALLTLAALDPGEGRKLRSHLEICPGCAEYLQQLVNVGERVRTAKMETDIETSAAYHREIVAALRAQAATREALTVVLQRWLLRWRVGVPVGLALLLAAAMLVLWPHQGPSPIAGSGRAGIAAGPNRQGDFEPTISNYMAVADRSFEQFDDLLTQQANKRSAHFPVFTARGISGSDVSE
jgi:anti-sigma factor RsiW